MLIDIARYSVNREYVHRKYLENPDDIGTLISTVACSTMCPCIVIAYWIGEISNWHPDALEAVQRLTKFYGYKTILNKPVGSPV